jgi:glutaredoxin-like protein
MIPLRDQDFLRQRFERELTSRLRLDVFTQRPSPIYVPGRQECAYCGEVQSLMEEVAALSSKIALTVHDFEAEAKLAADVGVDKVPATVIRGQTNRPLRYFGLASGTMFIPFVDVLIDASRPGVQLAPETVRQLRKLKSDVKLQVLVTTTDAYSPAMMRLATRLALQSVRIKTEVIELAEYPALAKRYNVRAVPTTLIGEKLILPGLLDEATLLEGIFRVVEGKPLTNDIKPGKATLFDVDAILQAQQQQQAPMRQTSSGLILPR